MSQLSSECECWQLFCRAQIWFPASTKSERATNCVTPVLGGLTWSSGFCGDQVRSGIQQQANIFNQLLGDKSLSLELKRSTFLCLSRAGIKGVYPSLSFLTSLIRRHFSKTDLNHLLSLSLGLHLTSALSPLYFSYNTFVMVSFACLLS